MKEQNQDILLLTIVAVAVFFRSFDIQFVGDNLDHIEQARQNIFDLTFHYFRPLTILTLIIDKAIWGYNHVGFHITNLLIHLVNVALIYVLALKFINERFFAFVAALLFLLHPIHSSSLFWISGRVDMICTAFYLLAMLAFIKYVRIDSIKYLIVAAIYFVLALLSKEMAITFPIVAAAFFYFFSPDDQNKKANRVWSTTWIFWTIAVLFVGFRLLTAGTVAFTGDVHTNFSIIQLAENLATFIGLLLTPGGHIEIANLLKSHPTVYAVIAVLALAVLVLSIKWIKKHTALFFFGLFVIITLLPVLRLAMRWYLYLPSVGFCLAIGFFFWQLSQKSELLRKGALILTTVIAMAFTLFITLEQHRWIKSSEIAKNISEQIAARIILDGPARCLILNAPGEFEETPVLIHGLQSLVNFKLRAVFGYANNAEISAAAYVSIRKSIEQSFPEIETVSDTAFNLSLENSESFFVFPYEENLISQSTVLTPGYSVKMMPLEVTVTSINNFNQANAITVLIRDPAFTVYFLTPDGAKTVANVTGHFD